MAKEKRKSRGTDWDDVQPVSEGKRFDANIETYKFSEESHSQIRLVDKIFSIKMHWVPTIHKDGSRGSFPKLCLHNVEENESCPYCDAGIKPTTRYFSNAIIRDIEESRPKKAKWDENAEFKKAGDDNWTPVRVVAFPASVMQKILNFKSLTKVKTKDGIKTFHVSHPKYGRDLQVKIDSAGSGSGMYDVQRESVSKLDEEELSYLLYDIDSCYDAVETEAEALEVLRSCYERGTFEGAKDKNGNTLVNITAVQKMIGATSKKKKHDEDEDDDIPRKKKKHYDEDDDIEDDMDTEVDEDIEEDEEEEEEKSSKKSKKSKKSSKKKDDDDDDIDDLDEDDEEEEEKPKKSSKKSKKKVEEEEDDDDDDLEDDEDEIEEVKKKQSKKKKAKDDEDEDDDIDELEDDEEDEKPSKKKKSSKKKKNDDDDDDDEIDDLDEDDEDEEEKPKKSKKSKKSKKDDDDDIDELEDDEDEEEEKPKKKKRK